MNPDWRAFLVEQNAVIDNRAPAGFDEYDSRGMLCDLSDRGLIVISGADAVNFMQGQFTTNVNLVSSAQGQLSAWCSPKGRVLAIFTLVKQAQRYLLMLAAELSPTISQRLKHYVLRSRVEIEDLTEGEPICIGCQGQSTVEILERECGGAPAKPYGVFHAASGVTIVRTFASAPRFEILGSARELSHLWIALSESARVVGNPAWSVSDILAGVPQVYRDTADEYLPQMLNLELIGSVDFDKGCYAGQEIVARAHYRGKIKRRMYLGDIKSATAPSRGTRLVSSESNGEQALGHIVRAERRSETACSALVVVSIDAAEQPIYLGDRKGPEVRLSPFPYMQDPS